MSVSLKARSLAERVLQMTLDRTDASLTARQIPDVIQAALDEYSDAKSIDAPMSSVTLKECLDEINNALNYWYPTKSTADEDERNARHVRLFQFRDRLQLQLKAK